MDYAINDGLLRPRGALHGCFVEAERAEITARQLDLLRQSLGDESLHGQMFVLAEEVRKSAHMLWDLADRAQIHVAGLPVAVSCLQVLLPCMSRTLRDMGMYYDDKSLSRELRWRTMWHKMWKEADLSLQVRFQMYNHFLSVLGYFLVRSKKFDPNTLEILKKRILTLREQRGIAPPPTQNNQQLVVQPTMMMTPGGRDQPRMHWAEDIFSRPLSCRTPLKNVEPSIAYGPWGYKGGIPNPKILFSRPFNFDRLNVMAIMDLSADLPHLMIREHTSAGTVYSSKAVHQLCISREGSALILKRWSQTKNISVKWAQLHFTTWEEMVLFHNSFVALKFWSRDGQVAPDEYKLGKEKRLFQARIVDDNYAHALTVYKDPDCKGIRLLSCVWEGEFRSCPVWTAFVTHQSKSATWLSRKSSNPTRVLLNDLQPYVFNENYHQDAMRQNKTGAFELHFNSEEAAIRFKEVFYPMSSAGSSEANAPRGGGEGSGVGGE